MNFDFEISSRIDKIICKGDYSDIKDLRENETKIILPYLVQMCKSHKNMNKYFKWRREMMCFIGKLDEMNIVQQVCGVHRNEILKELRELMNKKSDSRDLNSKFLKQLDKSDKSDLAKTIAIVLYSLYDKTVLNEFRHVLELIHLMSLIGYIYCIWIFSFPDIFNMYQVVESFLDIKCGANYLSLIILNYPYMFDVLIEYIIDNSSINERENENHYQVLLNVFSACPSLYFKIVSTCKQTKKMPTLLLKLLYVNSLRVAQNITVKEKLEIVSSCIQFFKFLIDLNYISGFCLNQLRHNIESRINLKSTFVILLDFIQNDTFDTDLEINLKIIELLQCFYKIGHLLYETNDKWYSNNVVVILKSFSILYISKKNLTSEQGKIVLISSIILMCKNCLDSENFLLSFFEFPKLKHFYVTCSSLIKCNQIDVVVSLLSREVSFNISKEPDIITKISIYFNPEMSTQKLLLSFFDQMTLPTLLDCFVIESFLKLCKLDRFDVCHIFKWFLNLKNVYNCQVFIDSLILSEKIVPYDIKCLDNIKMSKLIENSDIVNFSFSYYIIILQNLVYHVIMCDLYHKKKLLNVEKFLSTNFIVTKFTFLLSYFILYYNDYISKMKFENFFNGFLGVKIGNEQNFAKMRFKNIYDFNFLKKFNFSLIMHYSKNVCVKSKNYAKFYEELSSLVKIQHTISFKILSISNEACTFNFTISQTSHFNRNFLVQNYNLTVERIENYFKRITKCLLFDEKTFYYYLNFIYFHKHVSFLQYCRLMEIISNQRFIVHLLQNSNSKEKIVQIITKMWYKWLIIDIEAVFCILPCIIEIKSNYNNIKQYLSNPSIILNYTKLLYNHPTLLNFVIQWENILIASSMVYSSFILKFSSDRAKKNTQTCSSEEIFNKFCRCINVNSLKIIINNLSHLKTHSTNEKICTEILTQFIHKKIVKNVDLAKCIHLNETLYHKDNIQILIKHVDSLHVCFDYIPEMLQSTNAEIIIFSAKLLRHLVERYKIQKAVHISQLFIQVVFTLVEILPFNQRDYIIFNILEDLTQISCNLPCLRLCIISLYKQLHSIWNMYESKYERQKLCPILSKNLAIIIKSSKNELTLSIKI
ncbi:hypothetical protein A3Q56_03888 [Intoshia linei]|uniref:Uncharacterized protein n=1 Tax=Intoshia linei TaxID=1819745 RepID=A0A177B269_9BILA|nr:hypothetical protein A3Q56_03888 [Intoshia linei]